MRSVESLLVKLEVATLLSSTLLEAFTSQDILENLLDVSGRVSGVAGVLESMVGERGVDDEEDMGPI